MIGHYLKTALRSLRRDWLVSTINVAGLAIGLATCLLIGSYVTHELSYDLFHEDAGQLYRIYWSNPDGNDQAGTGPGLARAVEARFPAVSSSTVLQDERRKQIRYEDESFFVEPVLVTDGHLLDLFSFQVLQGDQTELLDEPGEIVLTRPVADRLFDQQDPIGRTVELEEDGDPYEVRGILAEPPSNSHLDFQALRSLSQSERATRYGETVTWRALSNYTYFKLTSGTSPTEVEAQIRAYAREVGKPEAFPFELALRPVSEIYLNSEAPYDIARHGDIRYVLLFGALGLLILVLAVANYANLATARSLRRAREIGVRKVQGATGRQITGQFLGESVLTALLALPLAIGLAVAVFPLVQRRLDLELTLVPAGMEGALVLLPLGLVITAGLAAGVYPALLAARYRPADAFRASVTSEGPAGTVRKGMVALQFAICGGLVLCTLGVDRQMDFIQSRNLGFDQDQIVTLDAGVLDTRYETMKNELARHPDIEQVAGGPAPGLGERNWMEAHTDSLTGQRWELDVAMVDRSYLETTGLEVIWGQSFAGPDSAGAGGDVILNQLAVSRFEIGDHPIGKTVQINQPGLAGGKRDLRVRGVVADFHNTPLREETGPVALVLEPDGGDYQSVLVRVDGADISGGIEQIRSVWSEVLPSVPFEYSILDQRIERLYRAEQRTASLFHVFAALSLLVAGLGLFGLTTYAVERRSKEISVRKVLGASLESIAALISRDYLLLAIVGLLIAAPVSYLALEKWLAGFAFRAELGWGLFVLGSGITVLAGAAAISYQLVRAATTNPADALRNE